MPANDIKRFEPCLAFYSKYRDEYESYVYFFSAMNYDPNQFLPNYMINKKIILELIIIITKDYVIINVIFGHICS